jgi:hypothetical protein
MGFLRIATIGLTGLFLATNAGAAVITQTSTFLSAPVSAVFLNSFDPSLGTLDRVELSLAGAVVIQVDTPPLSTGFPPQPIPYSFDLMLEQGFEGQGSFDVAFAFDALYLGINGLATGAGGVVVLPPIPFLFDVTFDATTDIPGIATPSFVGPDAVPPVFGRREDFLSPIPGFSTPLAGEHSLNPVFLGSTGPAVTPRIVPGLSMTATLRYFYTAAVNVPEPSGLFLLGLGMAFFRARRARKS